MSKEKSNIVGNRVRFTKGDYRPYVKPYDLVTSENFEKTVERAMKKRGQLGGGTAEGEQGIGR